MVNKTSIKVSDEGIEFLKRFRDNRRKIGIDKEDLSYWKLVGIIRKYFKLNHERYLELIKVKENE